jgi:endonuclease/exonuclease/phosphatase family metal-dependent hydrolase
MTAIVTWNIQNGKGVDGVIDLGRIARVIRAMGEADVICLQEIARRDPEYGGTDQAEELASLFPGFDSCFGKALDRRGRQYGNLILSRLPLLQTFNHLLPHPAEGGIKHMQRQAIEAVVETGSGPLRVMTTHLEYYSVRHRMAQIVRLRALQEEARTNEAAPATDAPSPYDRVPRPASLVLCGDFNLLPDDAEYRSLFQPPFLDGWRVARKDEDHPATFSVHERTYSRSPECRDYFVVTKDVAARIASIDVDGATDASDHQPLRLLLRD